MQKLIFLGASKLPTAAAVSEHTFGSFVRTFYEFEYSRGSDPEVHKFKGSNIDYCLHGHPWLMCCHPKVVAPEEPTTPNSEKEIQTEKNDTKTPAEQTTLVQETINSNKKSNSSPAKSSEPNDQLIDDPAEFIQAAPLCNHYLTRLQAHEATQKYDVNLELLLPGSKRPRTSPTPPRPPNSFMVYSMFIKDKDNLDSFLPTRDKVGSKTNAAIGSLWNALPAKDKEFFTILAEFAKHLHQQLYPNYVYRPSKNQLKCRGKKRKQRTSRK